MTLVGLRVKLANEGGLIINVALAEVDPTTAVISAEVVAITAWVDTVNEAEVCPAAMTTVCCTEAVWLLELRLTVIPPLGAGKSIDTWPDEDMPPGTVEGDRETPSTESRLIVNSALTEVPESDAIILAVVTLATFDVETEKVALVAPDGIVTEEGAFAAALLLLSDTLKPETGAGALRVTVPIEPQPARTLGGANVSPERPAGITVTAALTLAPPNVAVTLTVFETATALEEHVNNAVDDPLAMTTVAGTAKADEFDESFTLIPPVGAVLLNVIVPIVGVPPTNLGGSRLNPDSFGG